MAHSGHVERVQAQPRLGTASGHDPRDPLGRVRADQPDRRTPLLAEQVEEAAQRGGVVTGRRPHQPAAVMIDDHRQVPLALPVADLVDPDPCQPVQPVDRLLSVGSHPGHDPPHRAPGHPQQLPHRLLGGMHRQPGGGVVEHPGVAGTMPGPRHLGDHHPMLRAADPGGISLQEGPDGAKVQRPPAAAALALVVAATAPPAHPAASFGALAGPHRHHERVGILVELHPFDDCPLDTQQPGP